jgi:hypothetical protein
MTTYKIPIRVYILLFAMAFILPSCAKKIHFETSSVVPAARGNVLLKKDRNKNYIIEVTLYNLAEVDRLQPAQKNYVVWMENSEGSIKNLGHIISGHSFLSKKLKASFETISSTKPTKIFITAEVDNTVLYPSNYLILDTHQF